MVTVPLFTGFYTSQVVSQISEPSTVVSESVRRNCNWFTTMYLSSSFISSFGPWKSDLLRASAYVTFIWGIKRSLWRSWTMIMMYLNSVHITRYHSSSKMLATTSMDISSKLLVKITMSHDTADHHLASNTAMEAVCSGLRNKNATPKSWLGIRWSFRSHGFMEIPGFQIFLKVQVVWGYYPPEV